MAAAAPVPYLEGMLRIMTSEMDLPNDSFKVALLDAAYVPDTGAHLVYADLTDEITDAGYTAGGLAVTGVAVTKDAGEVKVDAADIDFGDTVSLSAKYMAFYDDTPVTTKWLLCYIDLNDGGGNLTSTNSDFDAILHANGLMRLRVAP
jgi:hypothetical protein